MIDFASNGANPCGLSSIMSAMAFGKPL